MAIRWGSRVTRSTGSWQQLGIEATVSGTTITVRYYGNSNGVSGNWTLTRTGGITGDVSVSWSNSGGQTLLHTATMTGTQGSTYTFGASFPTWWGGPAVTVSGETATVAGSVPDPATSMTATYRSDTRVDLAWTRPASAASGAKAWTHVRVGRRYTGGGWFAIATLPGTATSFSDTSVEPNGEWEWLVHGVNDAGVSSPVFAGPVATTPAAPIGVKATKNGTGGIDVSWTDMSPRNVSWEVQDETETTKATVPNAQTTWTDASPNLSVVHRYRVRAVSTGPRYSAWSAWSNEVALALPPAAPSNLAPNGVAHPSDEALVLSWSHNPLDTSPQTAYELRHRLVGAGTWTTVTGTTMTTRTVTGYTAGASVEWQVRTKGVHVDYSVWSALATFTVAARPTVTLTAPSGTVTAPSTAVTWGYFQAAGQAQTGWEAQILSGATLVAAGSGSSSASSWNTGNVLADNATYTARVRVRSSAGLWSTWAEQTFSVDYPEPAASIVGAQWQDGYGNVLITAQAVSEAGMPATVSHRVERSTDGGNTWALVIDEQPTTATVIDWQSPSAGTFHYRITAFSALPSMTSSVVEVTVPDTPINCVAWISGGPGFALAYPIRHNPEIALEGGRDRTLHDFDGRTYPVEHSSTSVPRVLSVSGSIMPDSYTPSTGGAVSTREGLEDLFDMPGPHLYRDPTGRVMYGTVSALRWTRSPGGLGQVSFTITRSAPPSAEQASSMRGWFAPRIAEVAPGVYTFINADAEAAAPGTFQVVE